jgi:hypothetical protein
MKTLEEQKTAAILKLLDRTPLTAEQVAKVFFNMNTKRADESSMTSDELMVAFARAIEKAHGIE